MKPPNRPARCIHSIPAPARCHYVVLLGDNAVRPSVAREAAGALGSRDLPIRTGMKYSSCVKKPLNLLEPRKTASQ